LNLFHGLNGDVVVWCKSVNRGKIIRRNTFQDLILLDDFKVFFVNAHISSGNLWTGAVRWLEGEGTAAGRWIELLAEMSSSEREEAVR
jgi:hypothetical protein